MVSEWNLFDDFVLVDDNFLAEVAAAALVIQLMDDFVRNGV